MKDSGIGISLEDQAHLFQRFHQVEGSSTRRFEGTGLGLALVKEFAELLSGSVSLQSELGKGSEFTVECQAPATDEKPSPLGARVAAIAEYDVPEQMALPETKPGKKPKVLIAEDNVELAHYVASLLAETCETRLAADGEEALTLARTWQPVLVLSDIMMPRRDGFSLCKAIKTDEKTSGICVVLLSALVHREALVRGWEAGADEYLFKPFHPAELIVRVRSLLSAIAARQERDLERKRRAELEDFAYFASHDLVSPLRSVTSFSQILQSRFHNQLGSEGDEYIGFIVDNARRMQSLLDDLVRYSATTRGEVNETVRCEEALAAAVKGLAEPIQETGAEITHGPLPTVPGSQTLITQVFVNLIGNALKYHSNEKPRVRIDAELSGNEWLFTVKDNGMGFDPQFAEYIFLIFKRLHTADQFTGTGIGLSLCKSIVERHGGRIWAESEPGKGSTFRFTLSARAA